MKWFLTLWSVEDYNQSVDDTSTVPPTPMHFESDGTEVLTPVVPSVVGTRAVDPHSLLTDDEDATPPLNRQLRFQSQSPAAPASALKKQKVSHVQPYTYNHGNSPATPLAMVPPISTNAMACDDDDEDLDKESDWISAALATGALGNDPAMMELFRKRQIKEDQMRMKRRVRQQRIAQQQHLDQKVTNTHIFNILSSLSNTQVRQVNNDEEKKTCKTMFKKLRETQRLALIRGSSPRASIEATEICPYCQRFFEAANTHAAFLVVQEMMTKSDATAEYLPTHLESLGKTGTMWADINIPENLTLFGIFPLGSRAAKMMKDAKALAHQVNYGQDLKDDEVRLMGNLHLYAPQNTNEAVNSFKTFCSLMKILFSETSFLYQTMYHHLAWFESHQRPFFISQNQGKLLTIFLYDSDRHVQHFLQGISDSDHVNMPREPYKELVDGLVEIRTRVMKGYLSMDLPSIFSLKVKDSQRQVFRQKDEDPIQEDKAPKNQNAQQQKQGQQKNEQKVKANPAPAVPGKDIYVHRIILVSMKPGAYLAVSN